MIITSHVYTQKDKRTYSHYLSLGYEPLTVDWSRYFQFYVKVEDLPNNSRARVVAKCELCNTEREVSYHQYRKICHQCNNKKPTTKETRERQSKARKGKQTGSDNPSWKGGKPKCEKCNVTMKSWHTKRCRKCFLEDGQDGERNPVWKNYSEVERKRALSERKGYLARRWQKSIKKLFNGICDTCSSKGKHAHHLYNWQDHPDKRFDLSNGVFLCECCHNNFHSMYGKKNNTKQQYKEFKENY